MHDLLVSSMIVVLLASVAEPLVATAFLDFLNIGCSCVSVLVSALGCRTLLCVMFRHGAIRLLKNFLV